MTTPARRKLYRQAFAVMKRKATEKRKAAKPKPARAAENWEAGELKLYLDNDYPLYKRLTESFYKNLVIKIAKGKYDSKLAVKLFMYLVDEAAKKYIKELGDPDDKGRPWNKVFDKKTRLRTAAELRYDFEQLVKDDEPFLKKYVPKKYADVDLKERIGARTAQAASPKDFEITIKKMSEEYGVEVPKGFKGDELVRVYKEGGEWHVGAPDIGPSRGIENLTDEEWAPTSDRYAKELYNAASVRATTRRRRYLGGRRRATAADKAAEVKAGPWELDSVTLEVWAPNVRTAEDEIDLDKRYHKLKGKWDSWDAMIKDLKKPFRSSLEVYEVTDDGVAVEDDYMYVGYDDVSDIVGESGLRKVFSEEFVEKHLMPNPYESESSEELEEDPPEYDEDEYEERGVKIMFYVSPKDEKLLKGLKPRDFEL